MTIRAGGLKGWQWLFIIEGIPSVLLGIAMLVSGVGHCCCVAYSAGCYVSEDVSCCVLPAATSKFSVRSFQWVWHSEQMHTCCCQRCVGLAIMTIRSKCRVWCDAVLCAVCCAEWPTDRLVPYARGAACSSPRGGSQLGFDQLLNNSLSLVGCLCTCGFQLSSSVHSVALNAFPPLYLT